PQGTLYGGAAVGGVIAVSAAPGSGRPRLALEGDAGSFATFQGRLSVSGSSGRLGFSAGLSALDTENQRPHNDYDQRTQQLRQDYFVKGEGRFNGGELSVSRLRTDRWVADWQHRVAPARALELVGGANREWTTVRDGDQEKDERLTGLYGQARVEPVRDLTVT